MAGQRKAYGENKRGGGMKRLVRMHLRREDCGKCGSRVGAKISIWMQNEKHDMPSTQLREMQNRRSLLLLKTIKKTSFISPMRKENQDIIGEKFIRGDGGNLSLDDTSKKLAWIIVEYRVSVVSKSSTC